MSNLTTIFTRTKKFFSWLLFLLLLVLLVTGCGGGVDTETAVLQTIAARDATATQQAAEATAAVPPTETATSTPLPTDTPVPPTATNTAVPPTHTATATFPPPTATATAVPPTLTPTPVPATPVLDLSLSPNYGSTTLTTGFLPDPYTIDMLSGGNVDVSYLNGIGCTGYATAAPDFRLFWEGNGTQLNLMFIPEFSGDDTTLIINDPSGSWYCSDDFDGLNPGIRFNSARSGQYDIWIGSFSASENISGQLNITEFDIPPSASALPEGQLDHSLTPNYGSTTLAAGFLPDPYTVSMVSGGAVDASYLNGFGCTGYATAAPDFRLNWEGNGDVLNFMFIPEFSGDDTTLIINDPAGNWYCSDDFDGLNPGIRFSSALSGQYDIWIGSYSSEENISGELIVSELTIP